MWLRTSLQSKDTHFHYWSRRVFYCISFRAWFGLRSTLLSLDQCHLHTEQCSLSTYYTTYIYVRSATTIILPDPLDRLAWYTRRGKFILRRCVVVVVQYRRREGYCFDFAYAQTTHVHSFPCLAELFTLLGCILKIVFQVHCYSRRGCYGSSVPTYLITVKKTSVEEKNQLAMNIFSILV